MKDSKTVIIAIGAISGGGKTAVTKKLNEMLRGSAALHFDDYDFDKAPENLIAWVEDGADYNEWSLDPLIADIRKQLADTRLSYLLLDYPFAYMNSDLKYLIDFAVYIDTPLDVAMARRILRDQQEATADDIHNELKFYLEHGRPAFLESKNSIKPSSDLVVDGSLPVEAIAAHIKLEVTKYEQN